MMAIWIFLGFLLVGIVKAQYPCVYCMPFRQPINIIGQWSGWTEWGLCSDKFGVTSQTRRRTCLNGNQCQGGDAEEARQCLGVLRDSPIQNTWTEWGVWSECNGTIQSRTRGCQCDKAINLDQCNCIGESFQEQQCNQTVPIIPVLEPCTTCQTNICSQCPANYPLPCYTCVGVQIPGKR